MTTEDGGSAFPRKASESRNGTMVTRIEGSRGLSKREWFAGQALPAVMKDMPNGSVDEIAAASYGIADAMLRAGAR